MKVTNWRVETQETAVRYESNARRGVYPEINGPREGINCP